MKIDNKGFTLIELLMTIVLLAIVVLVAAPIVGNALNNSKQKSYDIMISNILTASKAYYEECKYNGTKIGCTIPNENKQISVTLQELVNYGFLNGSNETICNAENVCEVKNIIRNPKDQEDIGSCEIKIKESITVEGRVSYYVESLSTDDLCPKTEELGSVS